MADLRKFLSKQVGTSPSNGYFLQTDGTVSAWAAVDLSGYVPYTGATGNVDLGIHNLTVDTNSLFVDSVNHRVGIGTTTPGVKLDVNGGGKFAGNVDFQKYKAIAMACDNDTSFPASPATGQWFYRSDIKTLFIYEGAWKAICSFGAVTLYVNGTNGTNAVGQGYSSGSGAVKTWQYAFDLIPPINGGNVTINVTGEAYSETATLQGKLFTGAYTITIQGTKSTLESLTVGTGSTQGISVVGNTSLQYATVVRGTGTWTTDQRANKWVRISETGEKRIIDSNNTTTLTVAGSPWTAAPTNGQTMIIEEPLTSITDFRIGALQQGVVINDVDFIFASGTTQTLFGATTNSLFNNCRIAYAAVGSSIWTGTNNTVTLFQCLLNKVRIFIRDGSKMFVCAGKSYDMNSTTAGKIFQVDGGGILYVGDGQVIDGLDVANGIGIHCLGNGLVNCNGGLGAVSTQGVTIRNCVDGINGSINSTVLSPMSRFVIPGTDTMPNAQEQPTAVTAFKLVDTSVNFTTIGIGVGDKVIVLDSYSSALVTAVDSDTQLSLDADIITSTGQYYRILKANTLNTNDVKDEGLFTIAGIKRNPFHIIEASVALVAGTATVNLRGLAVFSSATNYTITLQSPITGKTYGVVNNSGTSFTITSSDATETSTIRYICIGN